MNTTIPTPVSLRARAAMLSTSAMNQRGNPSTGTDLRQTADAVRHKFLWQNCIAASQPKSAKEHAPNDTGANVQNL